MTCPYCSAFVPKNANFCPNCGRSVAHPDYSENSTPEQIRPRFDIFWLTLLGSLVLSFILISIFNLPVFILGAFLPFIGFRLHGRRS